MSGRAATLWPVGSERIDQAMPWVLRALWIAVLVTGGRALDGALADAGSTAGEVARWLGLAGWVIGVAAMAVPAVVTLTATRVLVPLTIPLAVAIWIGGATTTDGGIFLAAASLATVVALTSPVGRGFVQASAYGDEDRHLLRPPLPYLLVAGLAWAIWATVIVVAAVATAAGRPIVAACSGALGLVGLALGFTRWHRLTRRWIVIVPVGIVLHDHLVLAETLMLRRQEIARLGLAPSGTDAADLTGPAPGHAIEIRTTEPVTVLLGLGHGRTPGSAIHLTGCLVAPTRPGQVLAAAATRRLPVGAVGAVG
jgi:hypothetical protein